jgi:hypothetical protein
MGIKIKPLGFFEKKSKEKLRLKVNPLKWQAKTFFCIIILLDSMKGRTAIPSWKGFFRSGKGDSLSEKD